MENATFNLVLLGKRLWINGCMAWKEIIFGDGPLVEIQGRLKSIVKEDCKIIWLWVVPLVVEDLLFGWRNWFGSTIQKFGILLCYV